MNRPGTGTLLGLALAAAACSQDLVEGPRATATTSDANAQLAGAIDTRRDESSPEVGAPLARGLAERLVALREELDRERTARTAAEREADELRRELARCEQYRVLREEEWLGYTRLVATLDPASIPLDVRFRSELEEPVRTAASAVSAERQARLEKRRVEVQRSLSSLLMLEGVRSLDLLDLGGVHDGWAGPVVFRQLDHRGRLSGSLYAERLRLEGSRSSRTLTIVLENGHESHSGLRVPFGTVRNEERVSDESAATTPPSSSEPSEPSEPFASSEPPGAFGPDSAATADTVTDFDDSDYEVVNRRRIRLPDVDPKLWYESLKELFDGSPLESELDDGRWSPAVVRHALNTLLREDAGNGYYRIVSLAGVVDDVLREVHLEEFDGLGDPRRRIFADFLSCRATERGVLLELRDGAIVRGSQKAPFLDGELRLYLPRADEEAWRAAGVPGFAASDADEPSEPDVSSGGVRRR